MSHTVSPHRTPREKNYDRAGRTAAVFDTTVQSAYFHDGPRHDDGDRIVDGRSDEYATGAFAGEECTAKYEHADITDRHAGEHPALGAAAALL